MQTIKVSPTLLNNLLSAEIARYIAFVHQQISQPGYECDEEPVHNHVAVESETLCVNYGDAEEENGSAVSATAKVWLGNLDASAGWPKFEQTGTATLYVNLDNAGWHSQMVVDRSKKEVR